MRRFVALLVVPLVVGIAGVNTANAEEGPQADPQSEQTSFARVNHERDARDIDSLRWSSDLATVARAHSEDMARQNNLHHNSNLGSQVSGWSSLGENVGVGPDANAIHQAFMDSEAHRDNILEDFTQIGIGAVVDGDRVWITQVFRLPKKQSTRTVTRPAEAQPRARSTEVVRAAGGGRVVPLRPPPPRKKAASKPRRIPGFGVQSMSSLARLVSEDYGQPAPVTPSAPAMRGPF